MKLNILSDLHLGFSALDTPLNDADVVVLAGDIAPPRQAAAWALRLHKPVIYVPGNHEFYGSSLDAAAELKRLCAGTPIHVLDNAEVIIDGVRFIGSTLWTDFMLFGDGAERAAAIVEAQRLMRDFSRIRIDESTGALFTVPHAGPTVVVTHHAPSRRSIHPRFAGSLLNACFVSDAEHLVDADRVHWWIHGHTHDSFDYALNGTRIVCNPRGYAKAGVNENARFDPNFTIDV
jgi:Icc-related predicted phosphoesterase